MKLDFDTSYQLINIKKYIEKKYIENLESVKNVIAILDTLIDVDLSKTDTITMTVLLLKQLADSNPLLDSKNSEAAVSKNNEAVEATALLGYCYEVGLGVAEDKKQAVKLYNLALIQGSAIGQNNLGFCMSEGYGVPKDEHQPFLLYTLAANQGYAPALVNLGYCYDQGIGVVKDHKKAAELMTLAASEGNAFAQFYLGSRCDIGMGVAQDTDRAVKFYTLAANQGHDGAQFNLASHYLLGISVAKDEKRAVELMTLAANQGHAQAQNGLGTFYEIGTGVAKDEKKAAELYALAASQGDPNAQYHMGYFYKNGIGVEKDLRKALTFFREAGDQHHKEANEAIVQIIKGKDQHFSKESLLHIVEELGGGGLERQFHKNERKKSQKESKSKRESESIKQNLLKQRQLNQQQLKQQQLKQKILQQKLAMQEKRKSERESAEYLNKINELIDRIVCFPSRFNNYIKGELNLSQKMKEVNECVESLQSLLQGRNELLTKNRFKVERQEKNRQNDITHNDEKIKETNALLETITGIVQTIDDHQKTFNLSYFTDSASMKQLLREGELQKPEKFLQDLEDLLDSCKKAAAKFTENFKELEEIKTLIEGKKQEEGKRGRMPLFIRSDRSGSDPSEEEKKSQEENHEKREAAFKWMNRLDLSLQVTHKQSETIERDAKYHTQLQEERRNRKALALQERDARLQKKREEAEKLGKTKEEAEKSRKERKDKEKELFLKSKESIKDLQSPSIKQLEVLFATDISFEIETEVKVRKEPESFNTRISSASKSSRPSKKRTLESLTDLSSTLNVYDQLSILEKTLTTIPYEDKALTQTEATITYNALLGVCARAMECLKKLRTHGLIFPEMARQFRNVVFHSGDQSIIPVIDKDPKANQESLNQLRDMAVKLLSYLNSDLFKKMRHEHASGEGDPIDPKTQIINSIDSPLFTKIVLSNLSQEKDLKTCKDMLALSDQELDSYKNYRNAKNHAKDQTTAPDAHLSLQSLLPLAEGFTLARISTYASYMKWHSGNERYRVIYYQFPKEKRAFYDLQIEAGKRFRHGL